MLRNYKMNKYTISQHILVHNRVDYVILLRFYEGSHSYNIYWFGTAPYKKKCDVS